MRGGDRAEVRRDKKLSEVVTIFVLDWNRGRSSLSMMVRPRRLLLSHTEEEEADLDLEVGLEPLVPPGDSAVASSLRSTVSGSEQSGQAARGCRLVPAPPALALGSALPLALPPALPLGAAAGTVSACSKSGSTIIQTTDHMFQSIFFDLIIRRDT